MALCCLAFLMVLPGSARAGRGGEVAEASITLTSPNGGESWQAGSTHDLTWSSSGGIESVRIEVSRSGSAGPFSEVAASAANTGLFSWTVPDSASSSCFVRVSDPAGTAADSSDIAFRIVSCSHPGLASPGAQMRADGGTGTALVTAGDGCAWTATSNVSWITVDSGASGNGSGVVHYTVAPHAGAGARTGTMTIGGSTFSLRQAGPTSPGLTLLRTVAVTPSGNLTVGGFARIYEAPTADRLLLTLQASLDHAEGSCTDSAHAYVEFTPELEETRRGFISCRGTGDIGSLLLGDAYFLVQPATQGAASGWRIERYDSTTWAKEGEIFQALDKPREADNDPMVALVNGKIDASAQFDIGGTPPTEIHDGAASFHYLFSPELQSSGEKRLSDTPHVHGSSLLVVDGVTNLVAANAYLGDLVVMRYDATWGFLGAKTLVTNGLFPEGLVFDGTRFYVAYLDTALRTNEGLPVSLNVRLAVFDREWDLVEDIPVTSYGWADLKQPGRPYLLLRGDRLYVSYDCDTIDPITHQENVQGQAYLAVYEVTTGPTSCTSFALSPTSAHPTAAAGSQTVTVTGAPSGCTEGSWSASTDAPWLTVSPGSGSGSGSATVSWEANTGTAARTGTATIAGRTFTVTQVGSATTALTSDWVPCDPPGGAVGGPGEDVEQPSRTRVLIARSQDGLHFERPSSDAERFLVDQADVPDAVVLPSGRVLVYFMAACKDYTPFGGARTKTNAIAVAVSDAGGAPGSWVFKDVSFDNAAHGLGTPFDPNIVLWRPEENLLRMFVSELPGASIATHSYTSTDGFTFTYEGKRYDPGPPDGIVDPENFRFDDSHWYIICGVPEGFATSSDDGATFAGQHAFSGHVTNVTGYLGTPNEVAATNTPGTYRVFAGVSRTTTGAVAIDSLRSSASPWTDWQWEGPVLDVAGGIESCEVRFPTVVRLSADNWLMFYGTTIPNCECGGGGSLFHCGPPTSVPACYAYTTSSASANPSAAAGSQQVTVTGAPSGCTGGSWTAAGNGSWLTVSPSSGSGSGSVTVSWEANTGTAQRTGTATIAGQTFTVTQAGSGSSGLTFIGSTVVTPTADFASGDFVRIFQRGTKVVVTFSTMLSSALIPGACPATDPQEGAYVYREFNQDMTPAGRDGVIACGVKGDNGGLLVGSNFYLALSGVDDPLLDGWKLSMYDAASWSTLPSPPTSPMVGPFCHTLDCGKRAGDPMLTSVNGLIDIDGKYLGDGCCGTSQPSYCEPGPTHSFTTHHTFFDAASFSAAPCPPSCPVILPVPPNPGHIDLNAMVVADGTTNFLAGTSLFGDLVLMRFDGGWNSLGSSVLRPHAWCPEGAAFDGGRYYVSFLDNSTCGATWPCPTMNARLAVFDREWNAPPLEEVALTSFTQQDAMEAQKPTILLVGDNLYVAYLSGPLGAVGATQVSVALFHVERPRPPRRHLHRM